MSHGKNMPDATTLYIELLATETSIKLFFVKNLDTRDDRDVQVSCLHKIGKIRFQWSKPRLDIDCYNKK